MSLEQWARNGWLRPHKTSAREISDLLAIVDRDLKDAATGDISTDWKFGIAYNAAPQASSGLPRSAPKAPPQFTGCGWRKPSEFEVSVVARTVHVLAPICREEFDGHSA